MIGGQLSFLGETLSLKNSNNHKTHIHTHTNPANKNKQQTVLRSFFWHRKVNILVTSVSMPRVMLLVNNNESKSCC